MNNMKKLRKVLALVLAMVMVLGMSTMVFAQTAGSGTDATITVNNASKGTTYTIYKLFGAKVSTATTDGESNSISYTGRIPDSLTNYFEYVNGTDDANGIKAKPAAFKTGSTTELSDAATAALKTWAGTATPYTPAVTSNGEALTFNVDYGFYVVTTSQGNQAITVDSTHPNATIYDKNTTTPVIDEKNGKVVNDAMVAIGDTVEYTVTFTTANYAGAGADAKQITKYTIEDTLPDFLSNVTITSLTIGGTEKVYSATELQTATTTFTADKKIDIDWVNGTTSLYSNGAQVVIKYTATVTDKVAVAGEAAASKNEVTLKYTTSDGTTEVGHSDSEISTYAAQINKVDASGNALAGATFSIAGLQLSGSAGNYTVTGATAQGGTDTVMACDANGKLVIRGLDNIDYTVKEEAAPSGYNKLEGTFILNPVVESTTVTYETYTIANGVKTVTGTETKTIAANGETFANVLNAAAVPVVNQTGAELPSTGGIGTTIFYIIGAILVIGAGVVLVTRRRMNAN